MCRQTRSLPGTRQLFFAVIFLSLSHQDISAQPDSAKTNYRAWWHDRYEGPRKTDPDARLLPAIHVSGNKFVNAKGDTMLFRGLSIADPDKLEHQGHWNKQLFEKVKEMGAMVVRIPVHPVAWRERTPEKYLVLLDQAVDWCTEIGMYVDIDWHSIGNLEMELYQDPMYNTTRKETYEFWRTIAHHFSGHNTVAFYELFNEPSTARGQLGNISWTDWKKINEDIIQLIRAYDAQTVPLVAGFDWAYDLTSLHEEPINATGIGYVVHPYAWKRKQPWQPKWEEDFGFAADKYPVVATEFGFELPVGKTVGPDDYGNAIIRYLEGRGISWVAWCFDPEWGPHILQSWNNYQLTGAGEFFREAMHRPVGK